MNEVTLAVTATLLNRRMALVFGVALPSLQTGRLILWGGWAADPR